MDYNKIIYILICVLIVLLIACFAISNTTFAKQESVVKVVSGSELYDGDYFSILLTDINGNPLSNQVVNITIIDANGEKNHQQVTTNETGSGMLQLNGLTPGRYNIQVVYGGNENYSDSNATQSLEIKELEVETNTQQYDAEPYMTGTSEDGCIMYWSDGSVTYRGETGEPITEEQYWDLKINGKP